MRLDINIIKISINSIDYEKLIEISEVELRDPNLQLRWMIDRLWRYHRRNGFIQKINDRTKQ